MSDNTKIEWADATVNAVNGCSVLSPGCTNCYAMRLAGTRMKHHPSRAGLTVASKAGPVWTGEVRLNETALMQPLRWRRPRRIFWNAHGDLFHEAVPDEWIDRCFAVMALAPQHTHQVLTKRSGRMRSYFASDHHYKQPVGAVAELYVAYPDLARLLPFDERRAIQVGTAGWPLKNVWLGVSAEDQTRADERIPDLLATPAAVRFLSCEPLLGPIDLTKLRARHPLGPARMCALTSYWRGAGYGAGIDWLIAGGESGPYARPMDEAWAESLRDQCKGAGVAFFMKQMAKKAPIPPALMVREMPDAR